MLLGVTQTEVITWSVLGFLYLIALLWFVRALMRGPRPINWHKVRLGVFAERDGDEEDDDE